MVLSDTPYRRAAHKALRSYGLLTVHGAKDLL